MKRFLTLVSRAGQPFPLLILFLGLLFLFGGSARSDSLGQLVVVPVSVVIAAIAAFRFTQQFSLNPFGSSIIIGSMLLILVQLVPLPPGLWEALPGHASLAGAVELSGTESYWRPLNLVPYRGWISLAALLTPLATLLLAAQLSNEEVPPRGTGRPQRGEQTPSERLVIVLVVIGVFSSLLAIGQVIGSASGPLYLHRITNAGSAVGLFANRNHQAVFLAALIPLLAVWASTPIGNNRGRTARSALLLGTLGLFFCLILVSGSRAGLAMGVLGLGWGLWIYRAPSARKIRGEEMTLGRLRRIFAGAFLVGLVLLTIVLSRAQSLDRAMQAGGGNMVPREDIWRVTYQQALDFFPLGTGLGAFYESYRMVEPVEMLTPYYVNHAHNDWLEVVHGGGLAVALMLLALVAWWGWKTVGLFRSSARISREGRLALAGAAVTSMLGLASFVDYPLRTAPLAAFFVIGLVWLSRFSGRGEH
jgi:O-antigen ligase